MPLIGETHCDAPVMECPDFFDQPVLKLAGPFSVQECPDRGAANDRLGAITLTAVSRVGEDNTRRISGIPRILSHSRFVRGGFLIKWR